MRYVILLLVMCFGLWVLVNIDTLLEESAIILSTYLPTDTPTMTPSPTATGTATPVTPTPTPEPTGTPTPVTPTLVPTATTTPTKAPSTLPKFFAPSVHYWASLIERGADRYDIDPLLIATIMQTESCGHPTAISSANALGLLQVMPNWFDFDGGDNPWDPDTNIRVGLGVLNQCLVNSDGNIPNAFACYNAGGGVIDQSVYQYPRETQHYHYLTTRLYADARAGLDESSVYDAWYQLRGRSLCKTAETTLNLSVDSERHCETCSVADDVSEEPQVYRVGGGGVNARVEPSIESRVMLQLTPGDTFVALRYHQEHGYTWAEHDTGFRMLWTALVPGSVELIPASEPDMSHIFVSAPVDLWDIDWVHTFGDTVFSRQYGHLNNYDGYCSGMHCGLDFGITEARSHIVVPVYAGLVGVIEIITSDYVLIRHGKYEVGYQHLESISDSLSVGMHVRPWEYIGSISRSAFASNNLHTHIEVRWDDRYAMNPAQLMPAIPWDEFYTEGYAEDARYTDPNNQPLIGLGP